MPANATALHGGHPELEVVHDGRPAKASDFQDDPVIRALVKRAKHWFEQDEQEIWRRLVRNEQSLRQSNLEAYAKEALVGLIDVMTALDIEEFEKSDVGDFLGLLRDVET